MPCAFGVCMKVKQIEIVKLTPADRETAKSTFAMMAEIFGEDSSPLGDGYLEKLLAKDQFWAFAALIGDEVVGGATAHVLPMTRAEVQELFIYDIAVAKSHQRKGIGRRLLAAVRESAAGAGIRYVFVPADNEDDDALDFYRALGGTPSSVTFFSFSEP